jgi:hypothetical protein
MQIFKERNYMQKLIDEVSMPMSMVSKEARAGDIVKMTRCSDPPHMLHFEIWRDKFTPEVGDLVKILPSLNTDGNTGTISEMAQKVGWIQRVEKVLHGDIVVLTDGFYYSIKDVEVLPCSRDNTIARPPIDVAYRDICRKFQHDVNVL